MIHNHKIESLFLKCFKSVYENPFDIGLISEVNKLKRFLKLFYGRIDRDKVLNKGIIGGPVNFIFINLENSIISNCEVGKFFNTR